MRHGRYGSATELFLRLPQYLFRLLFDLRSTECDGEKEGEMHRRRDASSLSLHPR